MKKIQSRNHLILKRLNIILAVLFGLGAVYQKLDMTLSLPYGCFWYSTSWGYSVKDSSLLCQFISSVHDKIYTLNYIFSIPINLLFVGLFTFAGYILGSLLYFLYTLLKQASLKK